MTFSTLVIDLDGTLVDDTAAIDAAIQGAAEYAAAVTGQPCERARTALTGAVRAVWSEPAWLDALSDIFGISPWDALSEDFDCSVPVLARFRLWQPAYREAVWRRMLSALEHPAAGCIKALQEAFTEQRAASTADHPLPGAVELLGALGAVRVSVLTHGARSCQLRKLERTGLLEAADAVSVSTVIGSGKPAPAATWAALQAVGSKPGEAVLVGDSFRHDVLAALALEMPCVWISPVPACQGLGVVEAVPDLYHAAGVLSGL